MLMGKMFTVLNPTLKFPSGHSSPRSSVGVKIRSGHEGFDITRVLSGPLYLLINLRLRRPDLSPDSTM